MLRSVSEYRGLVMGVWEQDRDRHLVGGLTARSTANSQPAVLMAHLHTDRIAAWPIIVAGDLVPAENCSNDRPTDGTRKENSVPERIRCSSLLPVGGGFNLHR